MISHPELCTIPREVVEALRKRYSHVPDLIFFRSVERARSAGDLFDILDTFPTEYPVAWDERQRRWVTESYLFLSTK